MGAVTAVHGAGRARLVRALLVGGAALTAVSVLGLLLTADGQARETADTLDTVPLWTAWAPALLVLALARLSPLRLPAVDPMAEVADRRAVLEAAWLVGCALAFTTTLGVLVAVTGGTGDLIAVSLTSKWGLVRHYWIVAKLLIAITMIASTFGFIHRWVVSAAQRSAQLPATGADIAAGGGDLGIQLVTTFGVVVFLVAVATVLSVYKLLCTIPRSRLGREVVEEEASGRGDELHPQASFVRGGLSGVRAVGVHHLPESKEHASAVPFRQSAGCDNVVDCGAALAGVAVPDVASLVLGEFHQECLERGPQLTVRGLVLVLAEVVHSLAVVVDHVGIASEAQVTFEGTDLGGQRGGSTVRWQDSIGDDDLAVGTPVVDLLYYPVPRQLVAVAEQRLAQVGEPGRRILRVANGLLDERAHEGQQRTVCISVTLLSKRMRTAKPLTNQAVFAAAPGVVAEVTVLLKVGAKQQGGQLIAGPCVHRDQNQKAQSRLRQRGHDAHSGR